MENPNNKATKAKLHLLFFQLGEILSDPPTIFDIVDWKENVEHVMNQISRTSNLAYENLQDLVSEAVRRAEIHVQDLDEEAAPEQTKRSDHEYFQQVSFVTSEINSLKSI